MYYNVKLWRVRVTFNLLGCPNSLIPFHSKTKSFYGDLMSPATIKLHAKCPIFFPIITKFEFSSAYFHEIPSIMRDFLPPQPCRRTLRSSGTLRSCVCSPLPTFRDTLKVQSSWTAVPFTIRPVYSPETSVNCQHTPRNTPEEKEPRRYEISWKSVQCEPP